MADQVGGEESLFSHNSSIFCEGYGGALHQWLSGWAWGGQGKFDCLRINCMRIDQDPVHAAMAITLLGVLIPHSPWLYSMNPLLDVG